MAQSSGCESFQVGTRKWTDCVEGQATGGGLMPWIVVIPLGVMVLGMMVGFARQFSGAGQRRAKAHGAAGTAGTWLIFVSFVELAIGLGSLEAERRAAGSGGGFSIAATVLLGVGALLFVIGVYLKIRGRRRARIYNSGVPGEAVIRAVHQTGTMVNNQPMYAFDVEVTGQGFAPVSTRVREVVPFWFLNRVGPQARVPVKVDPQNPTRMIFDWDAMGTMATQVGTPAPAPMASSFGGVQSGQVTTAGGVGQGAQQMMPSADSLASAMQAAREATANAGSGWHVGKVIGLAVTLFVLVVIGGGLFFIARIFGQVSDVTDSVTDQVSDALDQADGGFGEGFQGGGGAATTIEVTRPAAGGRPVTFQATIPVGWVDVTPTGSGERQGPVLVDLVAKPQAPSEARIVVTRSVRYVENPAPPGTGIESIRSDVEKEFGDSLTGSSSVTLAGEKAVLLEIAPGADGLRSRQIAVMRGGQVLFVGLVAPKSEWGSFVPVFDDVVESWKWRKVTT